MVQFKEQYPIEPKVLCEKNCSIRTSHSWEEILEVLDSSAEAYSSNSGFKGKIRRATRLIGDKADVIKQVTSLVPDIDYSKPITGVLAILLDAFKRTGKVRTTIQNGIEELKEKFDDVDDYLSIYSSSEKIKDAVMTLYVSMLKAIEDVIGFYTKHIVIKGLDAIWSGTLYEESLLLCLEKISDNGKKLVHEAHKAHMHETHEASENVKLGIKRVDSTKAAVNNLRELFEEHIRQKEIKYEQETAQLNRQIGHMALELEKAKQAHNYAHTYAGLPAQTRHPEPLISQHDVLEFLDVSSVGYVDLSYILELQDRLTSGGQDRTTQIMNSAIFRTWLVDGSSKELLIHGKSEPRPISPISFFCAILMQNLQEVDKFKSLVFFCGCHPYEDDGGARTMIISLLAQLLRQQNFNLGFIDHEIVYQMDCGDIDTFCHVFGQLIRQVNVTETVFCVIDGINFYERDEESLQEMAPVLRFLLDLTKERAVFKILITSPSTTKDVRQAIEDEDYLALPEQEKNTQALSNLRFERQLSDRLNVEESEVMPTTAVLLPA
ncbi:hypothetical protein BKA67DRAFT_658223 [Truncatella angustata]|uniref:Fungal STAND N-terminal Goodbye domain-containing protein n=1 Tax=Truncatella angustata TaxID=152316 RepID=A0A9P8ZYB7_9PEZI|nr:uncharacterized protein BKA67DRAFT_658223 [Truncatella angustata]KAH6653885.1 hypothetical protein BKA67DRAFT_658223 [Truncatella angustata]KAH8196618.1 hypothetical protein TruAng_009212 [Truncatella angustata]